MTVNLRNPHLQHMSSDYLYHLNLNIPNVRDTVEVQQQFGDIKIVCLGGTKSRMLALAKYLMKLLRLEHKEDLVDLAESGHRYAMFKVGPVLCCSHGIGMNSMSVLLHELFKLVKYAKCTDPIFLRLGTSGGLGVTPGTIVITKNAFNGLLKNEHEIAILGKRITRPAIFSERVYKNLMGCSEPLDNFEIILGNTLAADCFYEGQGRLDGASCEYGEEEKAVFLEQCRAKSIVNIEMEATMFSSLARHVGIRAGAMCVIMVNRLQGDQVKCTNEQKAQFEERLFLLVGRFLSKLLAQ